MGPLVLEILDLAVDDGGLNAAVTRYETSAKNGEKLVVSWNAMAKPRGYISVGDGVAYVRGTTNLLHNRQKARPDELGDGKYAWHDSAHHEGGMVIVVVAPSGWAIRDCEDVSPKPVRFKVFKGRMAFFWELSSTETDVFWRIQQTTEEELAPLVNELNRNVTYPQGIEVSNEKNASDPVAGEQPLLVATLAGAAESLSESESRRKATRTGTEIIEIEEEHGVLRGLWSKRKKKVLRDGTYAESEEERSRKRKNSRWAVGIAAVVSLGVILEVINLLNPEPPSPAPANSLSVDLDDIKYDLTGWQQATTDDFANNRKVSTVSETVIKTVRQLEVLHNYVEDDYTPGLRPDIRSLSKAVPLVKIWGPYRSEKKPGTDVYDRYIYQFDIGSQAIGQPFKIEYQDFRYNTHQQPNQWWYAATIEYPTELLRMSFKFPKDRQSSSGEIEERNYAGSTSRILTTDECKVLKVPGWDWTFEIAHPKVGYGYAYNFSWKQASLASTDDATSTRPTSRP